MGDKHSSCDHGFANASLWDTHVSGQTASARKTGLMMSAMLMAETFLSAGWDFIGESTNGAGEIWWIDEGVDYPKLWWELSPEN